MSWYGVYKGRVGHAVSHVPPPVVNNPPISQSGNIGAALRSAWNVDQVSVTIKQGVVQGISSGTLPSAPANVQLVLQGQTNQESSTYESATKDYLPQAQNSDSIAWLAAVPGTYPIVSYNIERSENGGSYSFYANISAAAAASNYSAYADGTGPTASGVNCVFTDGAATTATGYPKGTASDGYQGNGWNYTIAAVDSQGNVGPPSASMVAVYLGNGVQVTCGGTFNGTINFDASDGGTTPSGATATAKWTTVGDYDLINPFTGNGAVHWNLNIRAFTNMVFSIKPSQAGSSLQAVCLLVGDVYVYESSGNPKYVQLSDYGSLTDGEYTTFTIPLAALMTDYANGLQTSWYKIVLQITSRGAGQVFWIDNWHFV